MKPYTSKKYRKNKKNREAAQPGNRRNVQTKLHKKNKGLQTNANEQRLKKKRQRLFRTHTHYVRSGNKLIYLAESIAFFCKMSFAVVGYGLVCNSPSLNR